MGAGVAAVKEGATETPGLSQFAHHSFLETQTAGGGATTSSRLRLILVTVDRAER
jgi:hypothetical protein